MNTDDLIIIISWGVFALIGIIIGVIGIIQAKTRDEIVNPFMVILLSLTPGIVLVGYFLLFIAFLFLIIEGPVYIISKIKRLKQ